MKRIDIILALITGEGIAILGIWFLKKSEIEIALLNLGLLIFFPILAILGVWISFLIGKRYLFVFQLAKFLLIGALFALLDLTVLNFLMVYFGITKGVGYSIFVAISFIIATVIKYIADKYWAFEKTETEKIGVEFMSFFGITLISGVIQVGVASLIVNVLKPQFGILPLIWANIGKISGILVASAWNFLGYKFIVFKK